VGDFTIELHTFLCYIEFSIKFFFLKWSVQFFTFIGQSWEFGLKYSPSLANIYETIFSNVSKSLSWYVTAKTYNYLVSYLNVLKLADHLNLFIKNFWRNFACLFETVFWVSPTSIMSVNYWKTTDDNYIKPQIFLHIYIYIIYNDIANKIQNMEMKSIIVDYFINRLYFIK